MTRATPESKVPRANRAPRESKGRKGRRAPRETPALQARRVIKAQKVTRVTPAQLERLGLRGLREILALRDRGANKVLKESRGLRVIQEKPVLRV